ncbi:zinc finger FYVE domain-containing protein 21-like isoform X2 [Acanthaster planci]|uniref:Zinc finger FYVE domain-containing protein 21-like isoform X2 n=1 Tax=Acanthaster planci TaxID=133434 RepID=A0A8B7YXU0_ACAPL|nr:zinc finger FYVE domain-containing protein 21-like isoform X2 [Acanthaster planci]
MADSGKKLVRSKSGLRMVSVEDRDSSPFQLEEPHWVPDVQHHCRRCGKCFCGQCCSSKVPLPRMNFVDPVRMCEECAVVSKKENEFFDKQLKLLVNGSNFTLKSNELENDKAEAFCHLSANHRSLFFSEEKPDRENNRPSKWVHDPVNLTSIQEVKIQTAGNETNQRNAVITSMSIKYRYIDESRDLLLFVSDDYSRKTASSWIIAMQKAMKMLQPTMELPTS